MAKLSTTSQCVVESCNGVSGLKLQQNVPIPQLGENDVLLKVQAVSLNSRDNQIINVSPH
jgi:NADPH:quinone reductase-like Zn-dependent oxidoreductase